MGYHVPRVCVGGWADAGRQREKESHNNPAANVTGPAHFEKFFITSPWLGLSQAVKDSDEDYRRVVDRLGESNLSHLRLKEESR